MTKQELNKRYSEIMRRITLEEYPDFDWDRLEDYIPPQSDEYYIGHELAYGNVEVVYYYDVYLGIAHIVLVDNDNGEEIREEYGKDAEPWIFP